MLAVCLGFGVAISCRGHDPPYFLSIFSGFSKTFTSLKSSVGALPHSTLHLYIAKEVVFFEGIVTQGLVLEQYMIHLFVRKEFKKKVLHLSMTLLSVHSTGAT